MLHELPYRQMTAERMLLGDRLFQRTPNYLPIQNRLKITPNKSSELNSPVIVLS
jgi:hypothetical protein